MGEVVGWYELDGRRRWLRASVGARQDGPIPETNVQIEGGPGTTGWLGGYTIEEFRPGDPRWNAHTVWMRLHHEATEEEARELAARLSLWVLSGRWRELPLPPGAERAE